MSAELTARPRLHGWPVPALLLDGHGLVIEMTDAAAALGGPSWRRAVASQGSVAELLAPFEELEACPRGELTREGKTFGYELTSWAGGEGLFLCVLADRTELASLRRERDRLLEMAAMSSSLPSLLHEVRNPLAAVSAMVEVLLLETREDETREALNAMLGEVRRISLALQGVGVLGADLRSTRYHAVDHAVSETVRLLRSRAADAEVGLREEVAPLPPLRFEASVMRALVFNLVNNAIDACGAGGTVEVRTALVGDELVVEVRDDGAGMSPEVLRRATELFFTTKRNGSGIGLPLCARTVKRAGGTLHIESAQGRGTTVSLRLPSSIGRGQPGSPPSPGVADAGGSSRTRLAG